MKENAVILTGGVLNSVNAKTAHGLIRSTSRYNIVGVIDKHSAGEDAGNVLDRKERSIPVYAHPDEFLSASVKARYAIIGVAFPGGKLPEQIAGELKVLISAGLSVVSGLHDFLEDMPELKSLADKHNVQLIDIRKPRPKSQLKFWTGDIMDVRCPVISVMGTDCALGKRTTAVMITHSMKEKGFNAHMVFTGQTGWLQGHKYGFILDSTPNDFISGELEYAIVSCYREERPDVIFVEGQSSLCNPNGPCGSEYLLSGQCKAVILQHAPARVHFNNQEKTGIKISLKREIELISVYGSSVIAITLNTQGLDMGQAREFQKQYETEYDIPVLLPLEDGVERLAQLVEAFAATFGKTRTHIA